jgi:hypothetical protein
LQAHTTTMPVQPLPSQLIPVQAQLKQPAAYITTLPMNAIVCCWPCLQAFKLAASSVQIKLPMRLLVEAYGVAQAAVDATASGTPATALQGVQVRSMVYCYHSTLW